MARKLECVARVAGTARRWAETVLEVEPYILRTG
jgi:hypothetical protein